MTKENFSSNDLSAKMIYLCHICHQPYISFKSSNSILGKLWDLFLSLRDKKNHLLNSKIFDDFIRKQTEGLMIRLNQTNKHSMNFIQFIKQIELIAKDNQLSKEYLYKKVNQL
jgi:hypothetical protein